MNDPGMSIDQIHEMTGVPKTAIVKMAQMGLIPAVATGKGARSHWKVPLSQVHTVTPAYSVYKETSAVRRSERAAERRQDVEALGTIKERVQRLEARLARLYETLELQMDAPEPED